MPSAPRPMCHPLLRRSVVLLTALLTLTLVARAQVSPSTILQPSGVAFDTAGNLYFADTSRNQVYESTLAGSLVLIAGDGTQGFSGDGATATAAQLNHPQSVAIDTSGTLYIADTGNHRIRAVTSGVINTFAGTGTARFAGDNGPATAALLHTPTALTFDATGALLVCDTGNHRIRRITSGSITTIAGTGTQGFAGDNGPATAAQLDSPSGLATASDGRIYVSDTHNDRIRLISTAGVITTIAGTGIRGYAGDNGPATAARLALPRGLTLTSAGTLLFADSNNQRIRQIDSNGTITTLAGNGIQGSAAEAIPGSSATLDTPRSVAVSTFGSPTFTDAPSHTLHELVAAANLYRPAGLTAPPRTSKVSLTLPTTAYGQTAATVTVSGVTGTPQGTVQLLQGGTITATAQLTSGSATISLPTFTTGSYNLTAAYAGDGINPAAVSASTTLTIGQAIATATANAVTTAWNQPIPPLTGTLTGILPQDLPNVGVTFSTSATQLSPPGTYPITATLTGSASSQYTLTLSPTSGSLRILQAPTTTIAQPLAQSSYAGLPLILSATVTPTPTTPPGTVTFLDNGVQIATAPVSGATATTVFTSPAAGSHSIVASYGGNIDFAPSVSAAVSTVVGPMPDFTLAPSGSSSQTVVGGTNATYNLTVASQPGIFTGLVTFSVSGLPTNATATFAPAQVVPGSTPATVLLTVQTPAHKVQGFPPGISGVKTMVYAILFLPFLLVKYRRQRKMSSISLVTLALVTVFLPGCGDRTVPVGTVNDTTYNLTVTATSTDLAGNTLSHSVPLTLLVD